MLFLLLPLLLYYRCCCFSCGYCCRLIFSLVLQVVPVLHASDLVPLVSFLQLLAAATFSPETRLFQTIRAQLQTTANHMTESLQMAMLSGAYCPAMDCRACAVLRFEAFDWRFDHRLEDVLPCFRGALDAYEPGDMYPTELVQRFKAYNEHAPELVAVLSFLSEATAATGHWLCSPGSRGPEYFIIKFAYRNLRAALVFEAPPRQQGMVD